MKVDGHCYCGKITFEADADPSSVVACHCTDCQELTGSTYRTVVTANNLVILSGEPKVWMKKADSGRVRAQAFCPDCGSPIYSCPPDGSLETVSLRTGTLAQRGELVPAKQIWCRSAMPWAMDLNGIPKNDEQ